MIVIAMITEAINQPAAIHTPPNTSQSTFEDQRHLIHRSR